MKGKLDIKTIFIIILSVLLVGAIIFGKRLNVDAKNINKLEEENKKLLMNNDSLYKINDSLGVQQLINDFKIDSLKSELEDNKIKIKELKNKKNEIPKYTSNLSVNAVASSLSSIIEKSKN
jgi:hypothetical protein